MRSILYLFCVASGACALIYEIAWVRLLSVDFGTTVYAISTVLTVFMGGLALGSTIFGRWVDRGRNPLVMYAGLEIALGLYSALFMMTREQLHQLSVGFLTGSESSFVWGSLVKFLLSVGFLLPPATLIGGTFPVLAKLVANSPNTIGIRVGALYGWNTVGAVLGCLGQAYYLIPTLGVSTSVYAAAAVNGLLGLGAFGMFLFAAATQSRQVIVPSTTPMQAESLSEGDVSGRSLRLLYTIAFASGFATLATEVLWTRLFTNFLTGNVLIFATLLGAFLTGISVGSFFVARWVDRCRRLDVAVGIMLMISSVWLAASVIGQVHLGALFHQIHQLDLSFSRAGSAYLCLLTLFLLVVLPSVFFGAVLPLLFRWGSRGLQSLGTDIGRLIAYNTVGAILGSFTAGFVIISTLGVNAGILLLAIVYGLLAIFVFRGILLRMFSVSVTSFWLALLLQPSVREPILWFNGGFTGVARVPADEILFLEEGVEGTVGVWVDRGVMNLSVNGLIVAESSRRDLWDLLLKAHLPMLLHEDPREIAVVGLGAGVSLGAIEAYDVDRIDCIEISPDVMGAHKKFRAFNNRCWEDDRVRFWINDGRQFLLTTKRRYDIINLDPVDPPVCNQYTQDFFQLCRDRLNEGGLTVLWVPLFRLSTLHVQIITRAFLNVFPESTLWYDGTSVLLIGRRGGPLKIDLDRFLKRAARESVQESLALIGRPNAMLLLSTYVTGPEGLSRLTMKNVPENTDDHPYLEYALLLAGPLDSREFAANLEMLIPYFDPVETWLPITQLDAETLLLLKQSRELMTEMLFIRKDFLMGRMAESESGRRSLIKEYQLNDADLELIQPFL